MSGLKSKRGSCVTWLQCLRSPFLTMTNYPRKCSTSDCLKSRSGECHSRSGCQRADDPRIPQCDRKLYMMLALMFWFIFSPAGAFAIVLHHLISAQRDDWKNRNVIHASPANCSGLPKCRVLTRSHPGAYSGKAVAAACFLPFLGKLRRCWACRAVQSTRWFEPGSAHK